VVIVIVIVIVIVVVIVIVIVIVVPSAILERARRYTRFGRQGQALELGGWPRKKKFVLHPPSFSLFSSSLRAGTSYLRHINTHPTCRAGRPHGPPPRE
jgi:hypothetical protein